MGSPLINRIFAALLLFCATCLVAPLTASAVTIDWTPVGNPGNAPDKSFFGQGPFGAVGYSYRIGTYEVTNSQYVEFLNAKDPGGTNTLSLYFGEMGSWGIGFNGAAASGNKYGVISGNGNHPVNFVSWYSEIRFANWLNNGQGNGATETGAYTLGPLGPGAVPINGNSITRNAGATVFLPSENEWYKAAYYNPANSSYFQYPTSSNTTPTASLPTATPNSANYFPGGPLDLTNVGAYSGTMSPYGAFDMGGNVAEWTDTSRFAGERIDRGGSFNIGSTDMLSSGGASNDPTFLTFSFGFRVASIALVPEPGSLALAALGFAGLSAWGWRRRKRR